jgi:MmyB-like transcription regulator ligand binding domain/Helix-turn-helix domain
VDANELRAEVRDFLITRRGRITPAEAGLPVYGGLRRVPGLRREELALLAGLSAEYLARLERGNLRGVSEAVLEALCRALRLSEAERAHLYDLARAANARPGGRRVQVPQQVRPGVQRILDSMTAPALVSNARMDYLAANQLGRALYAPLFDSPVGVNAARFLLLDPRGADFYPDWDQAVDDVVALLRAQTARSPFDKALTDMIGELSTRNDVFRARWARHDVRQHLTGTKRLRHPVVGDLDLRFETMELPADPGLTVLLYNAEPASPSADALNLLASWAASAEVGSTASRS